jgi:hypothetical protein
MKKKLKKKEKNNILISNRKWPMYEILHKKYIKELVSVRILYVYNI